MFLDPLGDGKSRIELISSMGGDLDVVNDARASFDKISTELTEGDAKLIRYLILHHHTSPFRGVVFKFKVKAPLYVARQWWKHVVASAHLDEQNSWNEKSFRYVQIDDADEFYIPNVFRLQSASNRQASEGEIPADDALEARAIYESAVQVSYAAYKDLLDLGVGREQARGVLAPAVYTSWVWTVSLQALLHFLGLRQGEGAQGEIAMYANAIAELATPIAPVTFATWKEIKG